MRYRTLDHTADIMVEVTGKDLAECYANAAYALMDCIVDASKVSPLITKEFAVEGHDNESMLFNFLSEILFIIDVESMVFSDFEVSIEGYDLHCIARGDRFDPIGHDPRKEVKAITYHMMEVSEDPLMVRVVFDI